MTGTVYSLPIGGLGFLVVPITAILGCVPGLDPRRPPSAECSSDSWPRTLEGTGRFDAVFRVVREGDGWKLILPRLLVEEMRRLTPQPEVRRYAPNASATRDRLSGRVLEAELARDRARVRLAIENGHDAAVDVLNPLSLASLAGEGGAPSPARIFRSTIPETVPAQSSAAAVLVFDPLPLEAKRLVLSLPGVRLDGQEFTLTIEMTLLPYAAVGNDPVPGEPLLLYLLTASRPDYRNLYAALTAFHERHLATATRSSVSEREFLDYYRSEGIDGWMCRLGLPDAFSLGRPAFDAGRTRAIVQVSVAGRRPSPGTPGSGVVGFQVVKEGTAWKLTLPEDVVADIKTRPSRRSHQVSAFESRGGISVRVTEVVLDGSSTTVQLSVSSDNSEIGLELGRTQLHNQSGVVAVFHRGTLPSRVAPRSIVHGSLIFGPVPVESRELLLTLRFIERGSANNLNVPITLRRCP